MSFDYESLLIAIVFCGAAMSLTLLSAWLTAKDERFLLTWSLGMSVLVGAVAGFSIYSATDLIPVGAFAFVLLPIGCAMIWGSAGQFCHGTYPLKKVILICAALSVVVGIPFLWGWTGIGIIIANASAAWLLAAAGSEIWRLRSEAPALINSLCIFYVVAAISFGLCALVFALQGDMKLVGMPRNWAEDLNALVSIVSVTGIGAISIALNHSRIALRHQKEARTDQLTGLMNRRSLFDLFPNLAAESAVILFDLDRFKSINDTAGHDAGDQVLKAFGDCIRLTMPPSGAAARIGGEEFVVLLPGCDAAGAILIADRIRSALARTQISATCGILHVTASAGIACTDRTLAPLEEVLRRADKALYDAKDDGRDRVKLEKLRLVQV